MCCRIILFSFSNSSFFNARSLSIRSVSRLIDTKHGDFISLATDHQLYAHRCYIQVKVACLRKCSNRVLLQEPNQTVWWGGVVIGSINRLPRIGGTYSAWSANLLTIVFTSPSIRTSCWIVRDNFWALANGLWLSRGVRKAVVLIAAYCQPPRGVRSVCYHLIIQLRSEWVQDFVNLVLNYTQRTHMSRFKLSNPTPPRLPAVDWSTDRTVSGDGEILAHSGRNPKFSPIFFSVAFCGKKEISEGEKSLGGHV